MDTSQLSRLADEIARLGTSMRSAGDTETALSMLTRLAVDTIPGARGAGVVVSERGALRTLCPTDPMVQTLDQLQVTLAEGPCVRALSHGTMSVAADLGDDERWPRFADAALARGVGAVLSFSLHVHRDGSPAALNVYGSPQAFAQESVALGLLMVAGVDAAFAAAWAEERARNLEKALGSNREIGIAMGILMARHHVTQDQSFALLRRTSQTLNRKMRDLADQVVVTGELPVTRVRSAAMPTHSPDYLTARAPLQRTEVAQTIWSGPPSLPSTHL